MDQKSLKISLKQRIFIAVIAIFLLGSMTVSYISIVLSNQSNRPKSTIDPTLATQYEALYNEKLTTLKTASESYFSEFISFKSRITAFNEATANASYVSTNDLKIGNGRELTQGDLNYLAYYVGWCADESIFDSSFDSTSSPSSFVNILDASTGLIEGWNLGVIGMRLGGIREITVPSELAYGESREICGGLNKPLKFMIMALENTDPLASLSKELSLARTRYQYAQFGIDYDAMIQERNSSQEKAQ